MMFILFVPFAILFGWLIFEGIKPSLAASPSVPAPKTDPLAILKLRYANGDIDKKAYDRILKDLS